MTKAKKWFLRIIAVILCVINVLSGTSSSSIISAAIEESVPVSDEEIAEALSNAQFVEPSEDSAFILQNSNVETSDDYYPETADPHNEDIYYNGILYSVNESNISTAAVDLPGDDQVYMVQKWLNQEYGDVTGFGSVPENGKTAWPTIHGLTRALQHELGITSLADNFGPTTQEKYKNNILSRQDGVTKNMFAILQGALWCKGYCPGYNFSYNSITDIVTVDAVFDADVETAIIKLKKDAGLEDPNGIVTLNTMKALMSMDAFQLLGSSYGAKSEVRDMQQKLNRKYEAYIGLMPCDGVYARNTNKAVIYALQALEGMPVGTATGNFGNLTKQCCPEIPYAKSSSAAKNYTGEYYTTAQINEFVELLQFVLYVNGFGDGNFDGVYDAQTQQDLRAFQKEFALPQTGKADLTTWLSLFVSYGDKNRTALACDCATKLTAAKAKTLYDNGYRYVGRYLTKVPGGLDKDITREEAQIIFDAGLRFFPIYQTNGTKEAYFTEAQGTADAYAAIEAAQKLGIPHDTIIYFAVDFDSDDGDITNYVIPYFAKIHEVMKDSNYKTGIYATRNTCIRVSKKEYACSSFVSDLSSGYSGNLGFTMPTNWAFDQFDTVSIGEGAAAISIDKDGFSGRDLGVGKLDNVEYNEYIELDIDRGETDSDTVRGPIVNFLGQEIELFAFDVNFELPLDKIVIESEYDTRQQELNVIIGLDVYEYSQQRYGVGEKPTGEKYTKAFVEVKEMISTIKNPYSGINNPEFKRRFRDIKGCLYDRGFNMGIYTNGYVVGYMTISFKGEKPVLESGEIGFIGNAHAEVYYPTGIPTLTIRLAIEGSIESGLGLVLRNDKYILGGHMSVALEPSIGACINLYAAKATAGVGGEISFNFNFPFESFPKSFTAFFNASVFLEYTVLNRHDEQRITFMREPIYPRESANPAITILKDDFELIQPIPFATTFLDEANVFKGGMQTYAKPQIVNLGDNKMFMVYIDSAPNRIAENGTMLMYSIYDGTSWSSPLPIADDGTADFEPKICTDANAGVHILWQNASTIFEEGATLDETATAIDLSYIYWDGTNFSNAATITNNNQDYEMSHKIVSSGDNVSVVWQQNSENDVFGLSGTNSIYRKQLVENSWNNTETLATNLSVVTNIDTSYVNSENVVAYTAKSSTDTTVVNDIEVYYIAGNQITQLTNDSYYDYSAKFYNNELYWFTDNSIIRVINGDVSTKTVVLDNITSDIADFEIIGNENGNKSIVWEYEDDTGMIFFGADYNSETDTFSGFLPIERANGVVRGWDACMMSDGQIELAYCYADYLAEPDDNGLPYGTLSLIQRPVEEICDIYVDPITVADSDVLPGEEISLIADVYNNSSKAVNSFEVAISDNNGNLIETITVEQLLQPGETAEISFPFTVPSEITKSDYNITVLPVGQTDVNLEDNNTVFSMGFSDLAIQSITETRTQTGRKLTVSVSNDGYDSINSATVNLYGEGINGELLDTKTVSILESGTNTEIVFEIEESSLDSSVSEDARLYYIYAETDSYESNYGNNDNSIALYPDYTVTLNAESGGTVSGSGTYINDSKATIKATPEPGYLFEGWYENGELLVGVPAEIDLYVNSNRTLEARFIPSDLMIYAVSVDGTRRTGNTLKFYVQTDGETQPYLWSFYVYENDTIRYSVEDSVTNSFTYRPQHAGNYKVVVSVSNETGYETTYEQELKIKNYSVRRDSTLSFADSIPKNAKIVKWESSNEDVVTVDSNGTVTGHKLGETTVRAYLEDGGSYSWVVETELNWWQTILVTFGIGLFFLPFWVAK